MRGSGTDCADREGFGDFFWIAVVAFCLALELAVVSRRKERKGGKRWDAKRDEKRGEFFREEGLRERLVGLGLGILLSRIR